VCAAGHERREAFCRECGATKPRVVRSGVTTLARDVELQLSRKVIEVTASTTAIPDDATVVVGTEAIFRLVRRTGVVVFVDFDQYLLGQRERARRDAIYAVAKAGRLVGARRDGRGRVVLQTRRGNDDVITALTNVDFEEVSKSEIATARLLELPPFRAIAEIGGAGGPHYAEALREAGVDVRHVGAVWLVAADTHEGLRELLSRAPRPPGTMRLAIR
jgi:primosomal protein N'